MKWLVLAWFFRKDIRRGWRRPAFYAPLLTSNEARARLNFPPVTPMNVVSSRNPYAEFYKRNICQMRDA